MRKGSILVAILMLSLILFILGMSFCAIKGLQYRKSSLRLNSSLAGAIARAGMEDARIKFEKDQDFPPPGDDDQKVFAYTEYFYDNDGKMLLGCYSITVDSTMAEPPYQIIRITSIGFAGPPGEPSAKKKIEVELDIAPKLRNSPTTNNPNYFKFINWTESGSR